MSGRRTQARGTTGGARRLLWSMWARICSLPRRWRNRANPDRPHRISADSAEMLKDWADGTYSEYVLTLPTVLTRMDGLAHATAF